MGQLLRRFAKNRGGNFAISMALLAFPVVCGIGLAIDTSSIRQQRTKLQGALDAAAIAVAREGVAVTDVAAYLIADKVMRANFGRDYTKLSVTHAGTTFTIQADVAAPVNFGGLFGYRNWTVSALSAADIAMMPYEVTLVLDTTGSMAGGKLQAMKDAVLGLIDTMSANVKVKENLKFAMVPFSSFVNVGPQFAPKFDEKGKLVKNTGAPWLDLKGKSEVPQIELSKNVSRFEIFHNLGVEWAGCVETREPTKKVAYDVSDVVDKRDESLFVPAISIDEPDDASIYANSYIASDVDPVDKSEPGKAKKLKKYGVMGVPTFSSDEVVFEPIEASITQRKGPNANCVTKPIVALSTDYKAIKDRVATLEASGNTNILEGVAWGWRVLSSGEPFTEGAPKTSKVRKLMIVLTDGSNVFGVSNNTANKLGSTYSSFGFSVDERLLPFSAAGASSTNSAMNAKTLQACTNAKADGIEIFTIRLEEPDKSTGMMLKDCASAPDHFFDAPSRNQLDEVFGKIRDKITSVRISS